MEDNSNSLAIFHENCNFTMFFKIHLVYVPAKAKLFVVLTVMDYISVTALPKITQGERNFPKISSLAVSAGVQLLAADSQEGRSQQV